MPFAVVAMLGVIAACTIASFVLDGSSQHLATRLQPPSLAHPFGTDELGRDLLARTLVAGRTSLVIALLAVAGSSLIGTVIGLLGGFFRGPGDAVLNRLVDIQLAFPVILLALLLLSTLRPTVGNIVLTLAISTWVTYARVVRSQVLSIREAGFVRGARAVGAGPTRTIVLHIAPMILPTVLTLGALQLATIVFLESSLSFLGVGVQPPNVSWGVQLADGQQYVVDAWWVAALPGAAMVFTILLFTIGAEQLRRRLDGA